MASQMSHLAFKSILSIKTGLNNFYFIKNFVVLNPITAFIYINCPPTPFSSSVAGQTAKARPLTGQVLPSTHAAASFALCSDCRCFLRDKTQL